MTLRLTLSYWGSSNLEMGLEVDDEGHAQSWQTGGTRVGRFARELRELERTALHDALQEGAATVRDDRDAAGSSTAAAAGDVAGDQAPSAPSGAAEQLVGDGLLVTFDPVTGPPPGLDRLVTLLRSIREDLVESPVAALELAVSADPPAVGLTQRGDEPLSVRTNGAVEVTITAYGDNSIMIDNETHAVAVSLPAEIGPGWDLTLLDHVTLDVPAGGWLAISVTSLDVDALGDGVLRQADLSWVSS